MWYLLALAMVFCVVTVLSLAVISSRTPPPPPRLNLEPEQPTPQKLNAADPDFSTLVTVNPKVVTPAPESPWHTATASWYGPGLYGNKTADGTRYTETTWCVAHKHLPLGTLIDISYRGKVVRVPVKDRGPYHGNRQFDLSNAVASYLDFDGVGTIQWRIAPERSAR